ncbi:hypothetical protein UK99_05640 [Frankia casuarinae]|nr:hypothetical protein UK99_05640 [Frankia casuarinae]
MVHSGAGRIVPLRTRPLSMAEQDVDKPTVSLAAPRPRRCGAAGAGRTRRPAGRPGRCRPPGRGDPEHRRHEADGDPHLDAQRDGLARVVGGPGEAGDHSSRWGRGFS